LVSFESVHGKLMAGQSVRVTQEVLLSPSSVSNPDAIITRITVASGAKLVFADQPLRLNVREIRVEAGGELWMGSSTCRLFSTINITYHGTRADAELVNNWPAGQKTTKGLVVLGRAELHGKRYHPTWTRLARTGRAGDAIIFVGESVNWEVGQEVLVVTTALHDCPAEFADHCRPCKPWETCTPDVHQNEVRRIVATSMDCLGGERAIELDRPLTFDHYAGPEYQAEVTLLSRRITISGSQSDDNFGAHQIIEGNPARGGFEGVACVNCGQLNVMGRYPFHLHMMGEAPLSYFKDCVSRDSQFRAFTIHGTNSSTVERNVAYNTKGFAFYLEDGVEENNVLTSNLAAHVHPIKRPALGSSQSGTVVRDAPDLIVPADISASGFYVSNAFNSFIGNVASGGWSGFAFPNLDESIGLNKGVAVGNNKPLNRPTKVFRGNTAHSTGFYWKGAGSAIYVGARLRYQGTALEYDSGRQSRNTKNPDGSTAWMRFEDTKTYACGTGIGHWGDTPEISKFECWDSARCAMLFGEASVVDALFASQSGNALPKKSLRSGGASNGAGGGSYFTPFLFQAYDTWVLTLLSRVTFRGFSKAEPALISMTHSDEFLPQGINALGNLKFENGTEDGKYRSAQCGVDCGDASDDLATMAAQQYAWWDHSGDLSGTGRPSIIGSNRPWWNYNDAVCQRNADRKVWSCDWRSAHTISYIEGPWVQGLTEGCRALGAGEKACENQKANYFTGTLSLWTSDVRKLDLSPWAGAAGISGVGWHYRAGVRINNSTTPLFQGAPSEFRLKGYQLERGKFIVLSVTYPAKTTFNVTFVGNWWGSATDYPDVPMSASKDVVLTPTEDIFADPAAITDCNFGGSAPSWRQACRKHGGAGGPGGLAWFFDGTNLLIRIVNFACYNGNTKNGCNRKFTRDNISMPTINGAIGLRVRATCAGCASVMHNGLTYFTVNDARPTTPMVTTPGPMQTKPPVAVTTKNSCPSRAKVASPVGYCFGNIVETAPPTTSTTTTSAPAMSGDTEPQTGTAGETMSGVIETQSGTGSGDTTVSSDSDATIDVEAAASRVAIKLTTALALGLALVTSV
jgi:hypothetical protein